MSPRYFLTIFIFVLLTACSTATSPVPSNTPEQTQTITPSITETPPPTPTNTPEPLGSPTNPIKMGIYTTNPDDTALVSSSDAVTQKLSELSNFTVKVVYYDSYESFLKNMEANGIQIVWLPPTTYILAHHWDVVDAAMVINRYGVFSYGSQFMANADSGFFNYFDPFTDRNTTDAKTALVQLSDKQPCWVDETSPSGYVVPQGYLNLAGVTLKEPVITRSHIATLRALYIKGICDFGPVYAYYGDIWTSSAIQADLPELSDRVKIIWRTDPIIPNLNISFSPKTPTPIRQALMDAFSTMAQNPDQLIQLSQMVGDNVEGLKQINDSFYDEYRLYVEASGVSLYSLIGK